MFVFESNIWYKMWGWAQNAPETTGTRWSESYCAFVTWEAADGLALSQTTSPHDARPRAELRWLSCPSLKSSKVSKLLPQTTEEGVQSHGQTCKQLTED